MNIIKKNFYYLLLIALIVQNGSTINAAAASAGEGHLPIIGYRARSAKDILQLKGEGAFEYKGPIKILNNTDKPIYMACLLKTEKKSFFGGQDNWVIINHWLPNPLIDNDPSTPEAQRNLAQIFANYNRIERSNYFKQSNDKIITIQPGQEYQFRAGAFFDEKGYITGYPTVGITNNANMFKGNHYQNKNSPLVTLLPAVTFNSITGIRTEDLSEYLTVTRKGPSQLEITQGAPAYVKALRQMDIGKGRRGSGQGAEIMREPLPKQSAPQPAVSEAPSQRPLAPPVSQMAPPPAPPAPTPPARPAQKPIIIRKGQGQRSGEQKERMEQLEGAQPKTFMEELAERQKRQLRPVEQRQTKPVVQPQQTNYLDLLRQKGRHVRGQVEELDPLGRTVVGGGEEEEDPDDW